jgi:hypothetical protein
VYVAQVGKLTPVALRESAACRYLGMPRRAFRALVELGDIPHTHHVRGNQRIYLREWLDDYIRSCGECSDCKGE